MESRPCRNTTTSYSTSTLACWRVNSNGRDKRRAGELTIPARRAVADLVVVPFSARVSAVCPVLAGSSNPLYFMHGVQQRAQTAIDNRPDSDSNFHELRMRTICHEGKQTLDGYGRRKSTHY